MILQHTDTSTIKAVGEKAFTAKVCCREPRSVGSHVQVTAPSLCSCLLATALAGSLLCPRHLTLDKPFCSVGDHGEEK